MGTLLGTNDDIDFAGSNLLSSLIAPNGLDTGTYYIAVGGVGTFQLNVNVTVGSAAPEPGTLALVCLLLPAIVIALQQHRKAH